MSRSINVLVLALLTGVEACHAPAENNATGETHGPSARDVALTPGRWEGAVRIERIAMPGLSDEAARRIRGAVSRDRTFAVCLTPEDARRPRERFFGSADANCRYDRFTMADGAIEAVMRCSRDGLTQVMRMTGRYSPGRYRMAMTMTGEGEVASDRMTIAMTTSAQRMGDCIDDRR